MSFGQVKEYQPHQLRVFDEETALCQKIVALEAFLESDRFDSLPKDERFRLRIQLSAMKLYQEILLDRIAAFGA